MDTRSGFEFNPIVTAVDSVNSKSSCSSCIRIKINSDSSTKKQKVVIGSNGLISVYTDTTEKEKVVTLISQIVKKILEFETMTLKYAPQYLVNFNLIKEGETEQKVDWEIEEAIDEYFYPFIKQVQDLTLFKVTSQVQYLSRLEVEPKPIENGFSLQTSSLPNFINSAEWNFASTEPTTPSIQMILFIPKGESRPLYLITPKGKKSSTNSFLLPQWGGIVVHNPVVEESKKLEFDSEIILTKHQLKPVFEIFVTQLRRLLGIKNISANDIKIENLDIVLESSDTNSGINFWEHRLLETKYTVINTMDSISTLSSLREGKNTKSDENLVCSVMASSKSSYAFFHPTMVGMLYFPTEHKYAMYLPYFLPILVPVITTAAKLFKEYKASRMAQKLKKE
ncbi:hypothetical protein BB558_004733 [Smittium angustum]|uniref:GPI transamidase component PIG-S n=1 Tax=Smittium angustum TaxID=133377 RepID=A0A2U1J2C9_SMIAN|nr:hypothetical protein BB558_004733 [Smittium angustum]